jgi:3-oxoacyl-[acyl-carrier protein] reductase
MTALVTGGSRGIGAATCRLFGRLGARVAVAYNRDRVAAEAVAAAAGPDSFAAQADLRRTAEAARIVEESTRRMGRLDVLVANQGIWKHAPIESMSEDAWRETIDVNLTASYALCSAAARQMIPQRSGAIVLIASTSGQRGEPFYSHYSASKGGILSLTMSLADELAPHGIRVNAVAPGWVVTDMTRETLEGPEGPAILARIPGKRAGQPEEIADAVAFLASPLASYVYGEILCVNGGAVMAG